MSTVKEIAENDAPLFRKIYLNIFFRIKKKKILDIILIPENYRV